MQGCFPLFGSTSISHMLPKSGLQIKKKNADLRYLGLYYSVCKLLEKIKPSLCFWLHDIQSWENSITIITCTLFQGLFKTVWTLPTSTMYLHVYFCLHPIENPRSRNILQNIPDTYARQCQENGKKLWTFLHFWELWRILGLYWIQFQNTFTNNCMPTYVQRQKNKDRNRWSEVQSTKW